MAGTPEEELLAAVQRIAASQGSNPFTQGTQTGSKGRNPHPAIEAYREIVEARRTEAIAQGALGNPPPDRAVVRQRDPATGRIVASTKYGADRDNPAVKATMRWSERQVRQGYEVGRAHFRAAHLETRLGHAASVDPATGKITVQGGGKRITVGRNTPESRILTRIANAERAAGNRETAAFVRQQAAGQRRAGR